MPQICAKHNLVLAGDGSCVICRRTFSQHVQRRFGGQENTSLGERMFTWLLGLCLLGALASVYKLSRVEHGVAPRTARALKATAAAPPKPAPKPATAAATSGDGGLPLMAAGDDEAPSAKNGKLVSAAASAKGKASAAKTDEAGDTQPPAGEVPPEVALSGSSSEDRLTIARKQVAIDMYVTSWCDICGWAREDLARRGLDHRELDTEQNSDAAARLAKVNKLQSVPTFEIDGETLVGYSTWQLNDAIERAARKRAEKLTAAATLSPAVLAAQLPKPQQATVTAPIAKPAQAAKTPSVAMPQKAAPAAPSPKR
jgi:glutaredoxin